MVCGFGCGHHSELTCVQSHMLVPFLSYIEGMHIIYLYEYVIDRDSVPKSRFIAAEMHKIMAASRQYQLLSI